MIYEKQGKLDQLVETCLKVLEIKPNDEKCAEKHVKSVHEKKSMQSFKCFKCDAVFWESKMFMKHVLEQHGEKSFEEQIGTFFEKIVRPVAFGSSFGSMQTLAFV